MSLADRRIALKNSIPEQFYRLNKPKCEKDGLDDASLDEVDDAYKLITLDGFKWLLDAYGYNRLEESGSYVFGNFKSSEEIPYGYTYVADCEIEWPTDDSVIVVRTVGEANASTVRDFGKDFLARIAANRALIANVKLFFGITLYSDEEIKPQTPNKSYSSVSSVDLSKEIERLCDKHGISFEELKEKGKKAIPSVSWDKFSDFDDLDRLSSGIAQKIIKGLKAKK